MLASVGVCVCVGGCGLWASLWVRVCVVCGCAGVGVCAGVWLWGVGVGVRARGRVCVCVGLGAVFFLFNSLLSLTFFFLFSKV